MKIKKESFGTIVAGKNILNCIEKEEDKTISSNYNGISIEVYPDAGERDFLSHIDPEAEKYIASVWSQDYAGSPPKNIYNDKIDELTYITVKIPQFKQTKKDITLKK